MNHKRELSAVILLPIILKLHLLLGLYSPNPIYVFSGLVTEARGRVLPGLSSIDPNVGTVSQALGHAAARDLLHGHMPWWNFYQGVGGPLTGERLEESIGHDLAVSGVTPKLFLPNLSGVNEGPGFPNLSCLGLLSDRVLGAEKEVSDTPAVRRDEYQSASR